LRSNPAEKIPSRPVKNDNGLVLDGLIESCIALSLHRGGHDIRLAIIHCNWWRFFPEKPDRAFSDYGITGIQRLYISFPQRI
jgi:hypothetical protein